MTLPRFQSASRGDHVVDAERRMVRQAGVRSTEALPRRMKMGELATCRIVMFEMARPRYGPVHALDRDAARAIEDAIGDGNVLKSRWTRASLIAGAVGLVLRCAAVEGRVEQRAFVKVAARKQSEMVILSQWRIFRGVGRLQADAVSTGSLHCTGKHGRSGRRRCPCIAVGVDLEIVDREVVHAVQRMPKCRVQDEKSRRMTLRKSRRAMALLPLPGPRPDSVFHLGFIANRLKPGSSLAVDEAGPRMETSAGRCPDEAVLPMAVAVV